jgi:uncharacterized protein (TIGR00369 family)
MTASSQAPGVAPLDQVRDLSGLEFMRRIHDGRFPPPPIAVLMGFGIIEIGEGLAVFGATPNRDQYNPLGAVHGGYISTLLDSCMGCAVHTGLKAGLGYTTLELKVNFIRGVNADTGPVQAEGKVIHLGKQTATAEGRLTDARGRLLAHGTTTCLIFPMPPKV